MTNATPPATGAARRRLYPRAVDPFRVPAFRRVWAAATVFSAGMWMERVAVGWFVLDSTGSVLLTALVWSVRMVPNIVLGPVAGAISDRVPRARVLALAAALKATVLATLGALVITDLDSVVVLFALVAISGASMSFQISSLQALAAETAQPDRLASAVGLTAFGQRFAGAIGALGGGALIGWIGAGGTFLLAVVPVALAALLYARIAPGRDRRIPTQPLLEDVAAGLRMLVTVRLVTVLLALMVAVEILGFSYNSLLPVIAEQVLEVGPGGLGTLVSAAAVGSLGGTLALTLMAEMRRKGLLLGGVMCMFGLLLIALAAADALLVAIAVVAAIGAMAAMVDALEWILLQSAVPAEMRGRVLGGWNLAIGAGLIGPIVLGLVADVAGVRWAIGASGALLAVTAVVSVLAVPRLRQA